MTDQLKQQTSVFIDDELSAEECEFFVRRLQRDSEARTRYMRYQLIGAALRGEHVAGDVGDLRRRLRTALVQPPAEAQRPASRYAGRSWSILAGGGVAAAVAVVAVLALRYGNLQQSPLSAGMRAVQSEVEAQLELVEAPSYVVPLRVSEQRVVTPAIQLTGLQYLMHHSGVASSFSRTAVNSNVVAGSQTEIDADAEDVLQ